MIRIETGDFRELATDLAPSSVDVVLTDPPYPKEYLPLWGDLGEMAARVLKPGGSLIAYCGHYQIPEVTALLKPHLRYWWLLMIKHGGPSARLPGKWVFVEYKPALWYVKHHRSGKRFVADVIQSRGKDKKFHRWGQSVAPFVYLIEKLTNPGDLVLDPFLGGGTTAVACLLTGRDCIGFELDPAMADVARGRVAAQPPLFIPQQVEQQALTLVHAGPKC